MKKTLIALAAVAVSSAAMAQVTITGNVSGQINKAGAAKALTSVAVADLTFRATEDLGGGMTASGFFTIGTMNNRGITANSTNAGVASTSLGANANGPLNEDSGISLSGGFGTVAINNTRAGNLAASGMVFGASITNDFYTSVDGTRSNVQALSYTSPALIPGLNVSLAQANIVTATDTTQAAKAMVVGASYSAGPLSLGVQQKSFNTAAVAIVSGTEKTQTEGFVRYNAGVALIGLGYGSKTTTTGSAVTSYGISVPMGAITLGVEGAERGTAKIQNYGVRYALSKRTALHVSTGDQNAAGAASVKNSRIRVSHSF